MTVKTKTGNGGIRVASITAHTDEQVDQYRIYRTNAGAAVTANYYLSGAVVDATSQLRDLVKDTTTAAGRLLDSDDHYFLRNDSDANAVPQRMVFFKNRFVGHCFK